MHIIATEKKNSAFSKVHFSSKMWSLAPTLEHCILADITKLFWFQPFHLEITSYPDFIVEYYFHKKYIKCLKWVAITNYVDFKFLNELADIYLYNMPMLPISLFLSETLCV